jgi:hypothetical protein
MRMVKKKFPKVKFQMTNKSQITKDKRQINPKSQISNPGTVWLLRVIWAKAH